MRIDGEFDVKFRVVETLSKRKNDDPLRVRGVS